MTSILLGVVLSILLTHQVVGVEEDSIISISSSDIGFHYYSLGVPGVQVTADSLDTSSIKPGTKTFIVIDGFLSNLTTPMSQTVKNELLNHSDSNVTNIIVVDWGQLSGSLSDPPPSNESETIKLYNQVVQNVPAVAQQISNFLKALKAKKSIQFSQIHVVGHSLGAQIGGAIGLEVFRRTNETLSRISALDPAGPKYQQTYAYNKLDKTDAQFVDVYLTNMYGFGNSERGIGHANFYVNGGHQQPECQNITLPVRKGLCNHSFSWKFWNLAMNETLACPCEWERFSTTCKVTTCENRVRAGLFLPTNVSGNFSVSTENES